MFGIRPPGGRAHDLAHEEAQQSDLSAPILLDLGRVLAKNRLQHRAELGGMPLGEFLSLAAEVVAMLVDWGAAAVLTEPMPEPSEGWAGVGDGGGDECVLRDKHLDDLI